MRRRQEEELALDQEPMEDVPREQVSQDRPLHLPKKDPDAEGTKRGIHQGMDTKHSHVPHAVGGGRGRGLRLGRLRAPLQGRLQPREVLSEPRSQRERRMDGQQVQERTLQTARDGQRDKDVVDL